MISSPTPVTSGVTAGADLTRTTSRRRGLSYLRALSHSRSFGGTSPNEPSRSPRHYFQRSISYNDNRPETPVTGRRRSASRPNEPTSPLANDSPQISSSLGNNRSSSPPAGQVATAQTTTLRASGANTAEEQDTNKMARHRSSTSRRHTSQQHSDATMGESIDSALRPANPRTISRSKGEAQDGDKPQLPTIRFFPHQELRNGRPSLTFSPISRTLPTDHSIIRVGRYSEREGVPATNPTTPSDAPVGFKSKVVSRKHCEFSFLDGQWQIKDVASSSGTFLNHIRLSQPNTESRLFPIKDGDIVQLGIDFRGGEEMIFRCVKIRIECNRAWQKKPNNFNKSRHQQLQSLAKDQPTADSNSGECSICLGSVLPCQALFVAPCAHVWHYKCIRPLLEGKNSTYPQFQCPNCRAYSDLTADVDIAQSDIDEWMDNADDNDGLPTNAGGDGGNTNDHTTGQATGEADTTDTSGALDTSDASDGPPENTSVTISHPVDIPRTDGPSTPRRSSGLLARRQATNPSPEVTSMNGNIDMPDQPDEEEMNAHLDHQRTRTQTPDPEQIIAGEGPLTPRNNAGPFVFDGSAGRSDARPLVVPGIPEVADESGMGSL
ncbi:hypothetical protein EDD37DRAFT_570064 [Exophiala viscosa]|uniref:FHA domain-containing protein n=1 Tax=Exophiala viscosa TaxID=2486360 RepID=A0AAN6DMH9_9EURO|nr:hypothetical protein EDD36DRAFT_108646 [Exophiala viscosa]KAI1620138.1 hypothetical protein EDD37DRAFT_570064 [Exophiala viscosa]